MTRKTRKHPKRIVYCKDALEWLAIHPLSQNSIVTSIPDMNEVHLTYNAYIDFLRKAARLCLTATTPSGYTIFLQTDRKYKGLLSKSYFIQDEAFKAGFRLLWHKIVLRTLPGKTDLFRPTFSHMLCFSKEGAIGVPFPDIIERGDISYSNAFGVEAVSAVIQFLKKQQINTITDPFVGSGTTLAVAELFGLNSLGLDIDPLQCKKARSAKIIADHH